jgi:hypothetical protein
MQKKQNLKHMLLDACNQQDLTLMNILPKIFLDITRKHMTAEEDEKQENKKRINEKQINEKRINEKQINEKVNTSRIPTYTNRGLIIICVYIVKYKQNKNNYYFYFGNYEPILSG